MDIHDDGKAFIKHIIRGLTLKNGTILLAIMWVTSKGKLYHRKFPHVLGFDVTFGTNAEKWGIFQVTLKTSNIKNIPLINAYIPLEQKWLFHWCIAQAIPCILDEKYLSKTCIIMTDQDTQLVGAIMDELHLGNHTVYGDAKNRLCKWHKVSLTYCQPFEFMK